MTLSTTRCKLFNSPEQHPENNGRVGRGDWQVRLLK